MGVMGRWLGLVAVCVAAGCGAAPGEAARPNLVILLADDLGYGDLGVQGSAVVRTPHIDSLARDGVRFTQAYASAPLCAPTRAGLLTGRDANRFGYTSTTGSYQDQMRLDVGVPLSERMLSEVLHDAGYATGVFGKWHLGVRPKYRPRARGFDAFFGYLAGAHAYFDWSGGLFGPVFRNDERVQGAGYLTDAIAAEAAAFVAAQRDRPFFLYVPFGAVHTPFEATEEDLAAVPAELPPERRAMAAMVRGLDRGVGRVLAALGEAGVAERTLVVFLNDNGGVPPFSDNDGLRGAKGSLLEGGIRVPMLARWPAVFPAGSRYDGAVSSLDLFPTLAAAAGASVDASALDGVDLRPWVSGEQPGAPRRRLAWRWLDQRAIREGPLKLVYYHDRLGAEPTAALPRAGLYDVERDVGERHDLSDARPADRQRLELALEAWIATLGPAEPYWKESR